MNFIEKLKPCAETKTYIVGVLICFISLFIITGVVFLFIIANQIDVVIKQPAGETYTYFILIMDRILFFLSLFALLPLTIYQIFSKGKARIDYLVSFLATLILIISALIFFGGETHFYQKYKDGELATSKMFCKPTIETKIFDKILIKQGTEIPQMCQTQDF